MMFFDRIVDAKEETGEVVDYHFLVHHWSSCGVCHLYNSAQSHIN
jgi:hypothetical protein